MIIKYLSCVIAIVTFIAPTIIYGENSDSDLLSLTYAKFIQNHPGGTTDISFKKKHHHISIAISLAETGKSFSEMEKHQDAIIKYEEALTHYANGDIYYEYATSLFAVMRVDDALQAFKIAGILGYNIDKLTYYKIARAYSKLKNIALGFEYLDIAIMNGFRETDKLFQEPDLEFLRSQPEWQEWLENKRAILYPDKTEPRNWLVVEYLFNGNAVDNSINGHHGTVFGATLAYDRFGNNENAYYFDGKDDFIEIGPLSKIKKSNEITISYWFYLENVTTNAVCGYISDYKKKALRFGLDSDGNIFIDPGEHVGIKSSNVAFKLQRWYHYAMTVKGGDSAKIYVDGKMVFKTSDGVPDKLEDPPCFSIGAGNEILIGRSRAHFFDGKIDDFQIYSRVLLEDEIKDLYYSTKAP